MDGRTLEWSVASPAPGHTFDPMPVVEGIDSFWFAKSAGKKMPVTDQVRATPLEVQSILPFLIGMTLFFLSLGLTFSWYWLSILFAFILFTLLVIRSLKDEREDHYGRRE
ncbi:hypothetical protein FRY77_37155 [Halomonas sp. MG34]|nr:hypothetical protein [Halomonas sp. MG34]